MSNDKYPWRDAEQLRSLYVDEGMSTREVASHWGTRASVISDWLGRHEIPARPSRQDATGPWQDEATLRRLYVEEGLTTNEISDELGCGQTTVRRWLDRFGIETRDQEEARIKSLLQKPAPLEMNGHGYMQWRTKLEGDVWRVKVHRLLAVAEYGYEDVCGNDVHHKNGVKWDNRHENIEVMSHGEHSRLHNLGGPSR